MVQLKEGNILMVDLKEYYNNLYSEGKEKYWSDYKQTGQQLSESQQYVIKRIEDNDFHPDSILDFGCGEGEFLDYFKNARIRCGIDFSEVAIRHAKKKYYKKIDFVLGDEEKICGSYDLVTSFGVIEHVDRPEYLFKKLYEATNPGGLLCIICPNHLNTRGIIWQTLSTLFNVPMSLADKHVINYSDIKNWTSDQDIVEFDTIAFDVTSGEFLSVDLNKRLTNALRDAKMDNDNVNKLVQWLKINGQFLPENKYSGRIAAYIIKKN